MRRYLMVACGLVMFGAAFLAAQGGGEQKGAPPEARMRETVAKLRAEGLELKCKRCKHLTLIPFTSIEGWTPAPPESSPIFR